MRNGPELVAASNWESQAGSALNTSFTKILTRELEHLDGSACSVAHIYAKLHREALKNNIAAPPIHVAHPTKASIILEKLGSQAVRKSKRHQAFRINALKDSEPRVLITVRLQEDAQVRDLVGWKEWITKNIPPSVDPSQITVEAQFDAGSTVLLVAVPIEIWTALPPNDAYGFVAFVQSSNCLLQQQRPAAAAGPSVGPLAMRPGGSENRPFPSQEKRGSGSGGQGFGGQGFGGQGFGGSGTGA